MQLPIFKSSAPEVVEKSHYLCVILSEGAVQTCLLAVTPYAAAATVTSPIFAVSDSKDLLVKADQALQELGPESEAVQDTIFCCSSTWVDENGVRPAKQAEFDKLCKELSLRPLGYIVLSDVVSEHVVGLDPFVTGLYFLCSAQTIQVILVESGQVVASETVGVSDQIVNDCKEAFGRLVSALPSRTSLPTTWQLVSHALPETVLSEYQQEILEHDWTQEPLFANMPVIEYWSSASLTSAIASAAGKVLARQLGQAKSVVPVAAITQSEPTFITTPLVSENSQHDNLAVVPPVISAQMVSPPSFNSTDKLEPSPVIISTSETINPTKKKWHWPKFGSKKSGEPMKHSSIPAAAAGIGLGLLVTLLVLSQLAGNFIQLTVNVMPKKTTIQGEFKLTLDSALKAADASKLLLPAQAETVSITVSGKTQATGKREIGEKAYGQVKILNKTSAEKTFAKGTVLKADTLAFELFSNVTVPAATVSAAAGGSGELKSYGQAEASISAKVIGSASNLKADAPLTIADLSMANYMATVVKGLTGGTSQELVVVAAKDKERLSAELQSEAVKDAVKQFAQKSSSERQFVPPSKVSVINTKFSPSEGEEADILELTLTASASALAYNKADVEVLARDVLKTKLSSGETLSEAPVQLLTKLDDTSLKSSKPVVIVSVSSDKWPQIDSNSLIVGIAGRSISAGRSFLASRSELASFDLVLSPQLVGWLARKLPGAQNIEVHLQTGEK